MTSSTPQTSETAQTAETSGSETSQPDDTATNKTIGSGLDTSALQNRKEIAAKKHVGLRSTPASLIVRVLCLVGLVAAPIGRNHLTLSLGIVLGVLGALLIVGFSVFETTSRNGRIMQALVIVAALAFAVIFPIGRANSTLVDMSLFAAFSIAVIGLNLIQGFAGQVSLAQAAFMGIGAYSSALFTNGAQVQWGPLDATLPKLPFLATIPIAASLCFVLSVLIGFPALRVQGPWLAFITVAFNGLVVLVMNNQGGLTNGPQGVNASRTNLKVFGVKMLETRNYYYLCLIVLVLVAVFVWWMIRSPWGRAFKAIRDNPGRAASLGVSVPTYKLLAFAIGSMLAGIAGALYAPIPEHIDPSSFGVDKSFSFLLAAVIGGVGTLIGPFIGTSFITFLENHLRVVGANYKIAFAVFVILMMLVSPKGIVGTAHRIRKWIHSKRGG
jgi:branched-chain amino acid transport system permease protein